MRPTILVYGWYFRGNIGDNLFMDAFKHLFPEFDFYFTDKITLKSLENISAIFFGGGSFLYAKPNISDDAIVALHSKKVFYIGVGTETQIHEVHKSLMRIAKLVATRSLEQVARLQQLNSNTFYCPDIVYSLQDRIHSIPKIPKSVLILPNIEVVSRHSDPAWKHSAWEYFKSEFSQFLDVLVESGYNIKSFALCKNKNMDDNWAMTEFLNKMTHRSDKYLVDVNIKTLESISKFLSQFEVIITQRYHGIILSEMARIPYLSIHHHDKIKNVEPREGRSISYYGLSKQALLDEFNTAANMNFTQVLPIESNIFTELRQRVLHEF